MPDVRSLPNRGTKNAPDMDGWLTRNEVADLLGISVSTIRNLETRELLHGRRVLRAVGDGTERQVMIYDPKEVARVPKKDRYVAIRTPGETVARCFELFDLGKSIREIVIEMREMPELIETYKEKWLDHGGSERVITPLAWDALTDIVGPFDSVADLIARIRTLVRMKPVYEAACIATDAQVLTDSSARREHENGVWRAVDDARKEAPR